MLDSSTSVGVEGFLQELEFIKSNVRYYNINTGCTRVGIMTYSSGVYNQFFLDGYSTQAELISAIGNIQYKPGNSYVSNAINYATSTAFLAQHGGRTGVPHYGVLVTGSQSGTPTLSLTAANAARQSGMSLYAVGVGNAVNRGELMGVSNTPDSRYMMTADSFNSLSSLASPLASRINGGMDWFTIHPFSIYFLFLSVLHCFFL